MGTGYPSQYSSVVIFQRLILGIGGAQEVQTLPQAVTPAFWWCPSLFLVVGLGLYYELSTPALWWDMETGLGYRGQDQDSGHGLYQGRDCPPNLNIDLCRETQSTSSHPNVYTRCVCSHLPRVYRPVHVDLTHL